MSGIESCKAIDDHTVEFRCSEPLPRILTNLTLVPIVPRHVWSKMSIGEISRKFQNQPPVIGSGPFQIVEFEQDKFVRLKANPGFWGEQPKVDEIIFQMYTNNDTLTSDLKAGLIQGGNVGAAAYRTLKDAPGLETSLSHENGFDELGFNCYDSPDSLGNPVLLDPAFRWALAWAIDRGKIASIAWDGFAEPATTVIPADFYDPGLDYHWEPSARCRLLVRSGEVQGASGRGRLQGHRRRRHPRGQAGQAHRAPSLGGERQARVRVGRQVHHRWAGGCRSEDLHAGDGRRRSHRPPVQLRRWQVRP